MVAIDIDHLRDWVGKRIVAEQVIHPFPANALAGLLDHAAVFESGDFLPLPWHWLYFLEAPSRSGTGIDGHPARGEFLPPVPLPRRMWASGTLHASVAFVIGQPANKISTVRSVDLKEGKTGPLLFVTVEHELHQGGSLCIREVQNLVYRDAPTAAAPLPPGELAAEKADWTHVVKPDPIQLFRFSALTYNGHRIHYDRDYAVNQEFYPALVVHGPLLAAMLLDSLRRERPGAFITEFRFRALRPAFDTDAICLCGRIEGKQVQLWTMDPEGMVGMRASAVIA
jgi:3-methylfumaryl-CoA hydratase